MLITRNGEDMSTSSQDEKYIRMTTEPVRKLVCEMALPSIGSMLITAFYNLADTFFVGRISTQATGAIGIVFSYMALIQAVSFFFGHGCGNYISRALGRKDRENAQKMAATGFFTAIFMGIVIAVMGIIFMKPLLHILGATDTIIPEAVGYFRYILIATPFIMGSFVINNIMRMQGNAAMAVIGISSGAVLNVVLDPVIIFGFNYGTAGAGLATAISQMVGFVLLFYLSGRKDGIKIKWRNYTPSVKNFVEIAAGGLPSLARQGLASVAAICLNNAAKPFGDSAIAAFSVVSRVTTIANSAIIGFGQGFQPVCGFNYGALLYERVKKAFWFCVRTATAAMTVIGVGGYFFADEIVRIFRRDDLLLIEIAVKALRFQCITLPLTGFVVMSNMFLQNTRKTVRATVVAMARQGIMFIPSLFLLSAYYGLTGIQLSQSAADILSLVLAIPLTISAIKEMKTTDGLQV